MIQSWRNSITQPVGVERINDLNSYVSYTAVNSQSPIDTFYSEIQSILHLFPTGSWHAGSWAGPLAMIAVVSSVENYYRQIFSLILQVCSYSQKTSSLNTINLGSVIWHPNKEIERGAFEHISLASAENIINTGKKFIGIDFKALGLSPVLDEFDKICELRHGVVHSGKTLAGKNGIKLQLPGSKDLTKIKIEFAQFQELLAVCNALVVASNNLMFEELIERWAIKWRETPSWIPSLADKKFKIVWSMFYSQRDASNGTIPVKMSWIKCRNQVNTEFNL
jgi:hypothetical protein